MTEALSRLSSYLSLDLPLPPEEVLLCPSTPTPRLESQAPGKPRGHLGIVSAVISSGRGLLRASLVSVCLSCAAGLGGHVAGLNGLPEAAGISNFVKDSFPLKSHSASPKRMPESCGPWTSAAWTGFWKKEGTPGEASWVPGTWIPC